MRSWSGWWVLGCIVACVLGSMIVFADQFSVVWLVIIAWCALWCGVWQASRLRISLYDQPQAKPSVSALKFWLLRLSVLLLSVCLGVGAYTYYLTDTYKLDKVYQWQATLWVLGINKPLPKLVEIPAGSFGMGSGIIIDEQPIHTVTISKPFRMGQYELTFAEYDYYVWQLRQQGIFEVAVPKDEGWGRNKRPVINVSWDAAQGYVNWLTQTNEQGLQCRLPSEAEWEYAARAGTTTAYYWGDKPNRDYANYGKEDCCGGLAEGNDRWVNTAPVGSLKPNGWGLYDMSGNVYEWVQDHHHDNYDNAPNDGTAWESVNDGTTPASGSFRVLRGGSWDESSSDVRSALRNFSNIGLSYLGFRIVCSPLDH